MNAIDLIVAQVSKPAVSPISKSATREIFQRVETIKAAQVWKPAIQQTWKSALRCFSFRNLGLLASFSF